MARLGKLQLGRLAAMTRVGIAQVAPDDISRSLVARGLMQATGDRPGSEEAFVVVTAAGYRAIADATDAGLLANKPDFAAIRAKQMGAL